MARILVVDDTKDSRNMLVALLECENHKVMTAKNGEEGLDILKMESLDLIISDIVMPIMDGYEFVHKLRTELSIDIPIIFYTSAYSQSEAKQIVETYAIEHILNKPADPKEVLLLVDQILNQSKENQAKSNSLQESDFKQAHTSVLSNKLVEKIAELAETSNQLEEIRQYHDLILKSVGEGICGVNLEGNIIFVNPAAAQMLGYKEEEILQQPFHQIICNPTMNAEHLPVNCFVLKILQTGSTSLHQEKTFWHKNKSSFFVEYSSSPILQEGKVKGSVVCFRDITERKQMLKALEDERALLARRVQERTADLSIINAELIKANRLKDEFLASMSHELRTPLNAILGMSEILKEGIYGSLNDKQLKSIKTVEESGQHLLSLINDILDVSKINAGKIELDIDAVEIESLSEACLRLVKQLAYQKNISITSKISNNVQNLRADSRRLKQAIVNLLSNAIKFTPKGGSIGLEILGDEENQIISFVVWDTGIGIAPEHLEKLFVPFTQLDSSLARENVGTGLGLSLVKGIAELHGGGVKLESDLGKGSRFTISLPWYKLNKKILSPTKQIAKAKPISVEKVLIIEDSYSTFTQVSRYLVDIGSKKVELSDGSTVLEKAIELQPDLIILDILLSDLLGITGWDILKKLKADSRTEKIPVLVISVLDEEIKSKTLGASAYLLKPIARENLTFALHKIGYESSKNTEPLEIETPEISYKLLIVEDNQYNLDIIYDYLSSHKYELVVARNGKEALDSAIENNPDLILMDVQMPGMDGLEATRLIRTREELKKTPIIAMTALAMPGDRERCLQAGMDDYITKPIDFKKLSQMIKKYLTT